MITTPRSRVNPARPESAPADCSIVGRHGNATATKSIGRTLSRREGFKKERIEVLGISGRDGTMAPHAGPR